MKITDNIICLSAAMALCGCSQVANWYHKQDMVAEQNFAASEVVEPAHPVGVSYDVQCSNTTRKEISVFFNGEGLARILEAGSGRDKKTLIDFKKQLITQKNFSTNWQESRKIDPFNFPSVLDARDATNQKAVCLGTGASKGYPYHRWGYRKGADEWEVWTDDRDNFPIYFRAIKNGDVTTWTIASSWIDGSTYDKPTFFSMQPDPPPPEPEKTQAQLEEEAAEKARIAVRNRKTHHHSHTSKQKHSA